MKLEEMADLLDGLSTSLEKFMGKPALNDLRAVSTCLRHFGEENVAGFCKHVMQAREGKASGTRASSGADAARVEGFVNQIQAFLDDRHNHSYEDIKKIVDQVGKLKVAEIKQIGERIGCRFTERSKAAMLSTLENWLGNIKQSADQSSFTFSAAGSM